MHAGGKREVRMLRKLKVLWDSLAIAFRFSFWQGRFMYNVHLAAARLSPNKTASLRFFPLNDKTSNIGHTISVLWDYFPSPLWNVDHTHDRRDKCFSPSPKARTKKIWEILPKTWTQKRNQNFSNMIILPVHRDSEELKMVFTKDAHKSVEVAKATNEQAFVFQEVFCSAGDDVESSYKACKLHAYGYCTRVLTMRTTPKGERPAVRTRRQWPDDAPANFNDSVIHASVDWLSGAKKKMTTNEPCGCR